MWARLSIVAGLVVGVVAAGLLLGGLLGLAPEKPLPSEAAPSVAVPSATAPPTAPPSAGAVAWDALALPVHSWVDKDGIVRDGALGGIGPDVLAKGLESIMPGVDVTP
jgi:hypothetical protein